MRSHALLVLAAPLLLGANTAAGSSAVDHGQMGETWPVIEPDLMSVIKARLDRAQANGEIDALNRRFADKVKSRVMRPVPVAGISPATETRTWEFDPAIIVENDIRDHQGNLIATAGQRVNPFAVTGLSKKLLFVNGDDAGEVAWAVEKGSDNDTKIIFVKGSPFELMKVHQRRFYFDQQGKLTDHFGIRHTPALVEQDGDILQVTEQAITRTRRRS